MENFGLKWFFDEDTATFTYVIHDPETMKAALIDSVLNYEPFAAKTTTTSADAVIAYVRENSLDVEWILETHIHADHLTGAHYLKEKLGGKTAIGAHITKVLDFWIPLYQTETDTPRDGRQFDHLLQDQETIQIGNLPLHVLHTPGHTPACSTYLVQDAAFVGDTIFMPDLGTARTDFPGGSAATLYDSIQKILSLPDNTRIFVGHDYPPQGRELSCMTTVADQKAHNILVGQEITRDIYVTNREKRDLGKAVPRLLLPAIQVNMRAGDLGTPEANGQRYIKLPLNYF